MTEGTVIPYTSNEFPELDGVEVGRSIKFSGEGKIEDLGGENRGIKIVAMDFETENQADKDMKGLKGEVSNYTEDETEEM